MQNNIEEFMEGDLDELSIPEIEFAEQCCEIEIEKLIARLTKRRYFPFYIAS